MPLVISVSGVRGTIGTSPDGTPGLTPDVLLAYVSGYAHYVRAEHGEGATVVVGRDGRMSGPVVAQFAIATLRFAGIDVIDLDLSTTPTVELAVVRHRAQGGIVLSASHNPREYNALKLLNERGEFLSAADGERIKSYVAAGGFTYPGVEALGGLTVSTDDIVHHVEQICALPLVDVAAIRAAGLHVVVDCINSTGASSVPPLLDALGVSYELLFEDVSGDFAHEAEPLPKNLTVLAKAVGGGPADLGIAVDPDVDRLVLVSEDGSMFGEEYTLAAVADYVLAHTPGPVVSNLSSSRVLRDVADSYGQSYAAGAVGEVHVVAKMREVGAVLGGEGNGGIIYPDLHYGRDSLVGIALVLSHLATSGKRASELRAAFPDYTIVKEKLALPDRDRVPAILTEVAAAYATHDVDRTDGVKVDMPDGWVHLRASNTEPIVRVIAESRDEASARQLAADALAIMRGALTT